MGSLLPPPPLRQLVQLARLALLRRQLRRLPEPLDRASALSVGACALLLHQAARAFSPDRQERQRSREPSPAPRQGAAPRRPGQQRLPAQPMVQAKAPAPLQAEGEAAGRLGQALAWISAAEAEAFIPAYQAAQRDRLWALSSGLLGLGLVLMAVMLLPVKALLAPLPLGLALAIGLGCREGWGSLAEAEALRRRQLHDLQSQRREAQDFQQRLLQSRSALDGELEAATLEAIAADLQRLHRDLEVACRALGSRAVTWRQLAAELMPSQRLAGPDPAEAPWPPARSPHPLARPTSPAAGPACAFSAAAATGALIAPTASSAASSVEAAAGAPGGTASLGAGSASLAADSASTFSPDARDGGTAGSGQAAGSTSASTPPQLPAAGAWGARSSLHALRQRPLPGLEDPLPSCASALPETPGAAEAPAAPPAAAAPPAPMPAAAHAPGSAAAGSLAIARWPEEEGHCFALSLPQAQAILRRLGYRRLPRRWETISPRARRRLCAVLAALVAIDAASVRWSFVEGEVRAQPAAASPEASVSLAAALAASPRVPQGGGAAASMPAADQPAAASLG